MVPRKTHLKKVNFWAEIFMTCDTSKCIVPILVLKQK